MNTYSIFFLATSLTVLSWSSTAVSAEEQTDQETPQYTTEAITVRENRLTMPQQSSLATKLPLPLHRTPASVGVVPKTLVERQGGIILGDALKNISGVNAQTGFGSFDFFVLRGFDSLESGLVLTDGAAEPEVSFYNLYNVDTVEVLKGPAAFLYGGNPLSGTVNLVRKQPVFANFARISASYGRYQSLRSTVDAGWTNTKNTLAIRLNALGQDAAGYRDNMDNFTYAFNPALSWKPDQRTQITFNFEYAQSQHTSDSGLPLLTSNGISYNLAAVPRTRSYQSPFDISEQTFYRLRTDINRRLGKDLVWHNKFYWTDFTWPSKGALINGVGPNNDATGLDVFRSLLNLDNKQQLIGNQSELIWQTTTGNVHHTFLGGIELGQTSDNFTLQVASLPPLDLNNPQETATLPLSYIAEQQLAADASSIIVAPYLVNHMVLSKAFEMFIGGRFDRIQYTDDRNAADLTWTAFSPMLGAIFHPMTQLSIYANVGHAFAPPSSRVVATRQLEAQYAGFGRPIKTEKSSQFELGAKTIFWQKRIQTNIALFLLSKDDIAIRDANGLTQQSGDQRAHGLEIELIAQPTLQWHLVLNYAYTNAELHRFNEQVFVPTTTGIVAQTFDRAGNVPAFAPTHIANMWINKEFSNGLGLGLGSRFLGTQFIAPDNAYTIDSVVTIDAMVAYTYNRWRLRLNLKNLTNTSYETRGFGSSSVIPATPFAAYGGIEWSL